MRRLAGNWRWPRLSQFTSTGVRRAGDDYQDIIALELLVEMLEHHTRYLWVRVEADPVKNHDRFFLDDVIALQNDGKLVAMQVKFSAHPESEADAWTWQKLLERNQNESLLQKWAFSLEKLRKQGPIAKASLVSNRKPADEIKTTLGPDCRADFNKIDNKTRVEIVSQLGSEKAARDFFAIFQFELDRAGLEIYEETLKIKFQRLGGTNEGWLSLKDKVRFWVRNKHKPSPDGAITISAVRSAALWNSPRLLPEYFEVPSDYVMPSQSFHDDFLKELLSLGKGCLVLTGSPGLGKSTYLSYIYNELTRKEIPVIRHHYFLSTSDRTEGRLDHRRIAGSIISDLRGKFPEALERIGNRNPNPDELGLWIEASGEHFSSQGKTLILILDGLDHVWREKGNLEELSRLLEHLLPTPKGVVVIFGTQPIDDSLFPSALKREAPRDEWKELPWLDIEAVQEWLEKHAVELNLPGQPNIRENVLHNLADAFWKKGQGHPLHLRYTLKALIESDMAITPDNISILPGCPHRNIALYYEELWQRLPELSKEIVHLMSACQFSWPIDGIIDCIDPAGHNLANAHEALRNVRHLMLTDDMGLRPFHSSFLVFASNLGDHATYSTTMKQRALKWLRQKSPPYYKWAHEWLLEADLGNTTPLINGPDREWAIKNIRKAYPRNDADKILTRSVCAAISKGELPRAIEVGLLQNYVDSAYDFRSSEVDVLLYPILVVEDETRTVRYIKAETLSSNGLTSLGELDTRLGNLSRIHEYLLELDRRRMHSNPQQTLDDWRFEMRIFFKMAAFDNQITTDEVVNFAAKFRDEEYAFPLPAQFGDEVYVPPGPVKIDGYSYEFLAEYAKTLRAFNAVERLRRLLSNQNIASERSVILRHAVLLALEEGFDLPREIVESMEDKDPFVAIYATARKLTKSSFTKLDFPDTEILNFKDTELWGKSRLVEDFYYSAFFVFLANGFCNAPERNKQWLAKVGTASWSRAFVQRLEEISSKLVHLYLLGTPPHFSWIYEQLKGFQKPTWTTDREGFEYSKCAEVAINEIALDVMILNVSFGGSSTIVREELETAFSSEWYPRWSWINIYFARRRRWLNDEAVKWIIELQTKMLSSSIETFSERASAYSALASLSALHGLKDLARECVRMSVTNLISYGDHKDIFLFGVLNLIEACHAAGLTQAKQWICQLAPAIAKVAEFTDGDETNHLPSRLSETLANVAPYSLASYYKWLSSMEDYSDALQTFHVFLKNADLSDGLNQALAETAIDEESLQILAERAKKKDKNVEAVLSSLLGTLGFKTAPEAKAAEPQNHTRVPQSFPIAKQFPPDRFRAYLHAAKGLNQCLDVPRCVSYWLSFWKDKGGESVLRVLEEEDQKGVDVGNYDEMFSLAFSLYGKQEAYPRLVRAHVQNYGWNWHWVDKEKTIHRWRIIKDTYPDKWYDFIKDTTTSHVGDPLHGFSVYWGFVFLVEYCIFMGKLDIAREATERVVDMASALVSALTLPEPKWVACLCIK